MQICDLLIKLSNSSSATTTTPRLNVTPAEVSVLRLIKGEGAIFFNGNLRSVNRSNQAEANRLKMAHGSAFGEIFPGMHPQLPQTFDDVALDTSRIAEFDVYVPAPDEAPLLEEFTQIGDVAPEPVVAPKPRAVRPTRKKAVEDFGLETK